MNAFQEYFLNVVKFKYFQPNGRARRKEFWMYQLFFLAIYFVLLIVASILAALSETLGMLVMLAVALVILGLILPGITLNIRRLHDIGKSGWWLLLSLIPFGSIVLLVFACLDSQPGDNMYGPNPKGL